MWYRILVGCTLLTLTVGQNAKTSTLSLNCATPAKPGSCTLRSLKVQLGDIFVPSREASVPAKYVVIENSKLEFLPEELLNQFPQLDELRTVDVGLKKLLPSTFAKSLQLRRLDASSNLIQSIPTNVYGSCMSLEELNVANNKLHLFSGIELIGCSKLRQLNVSSNQLIDFSWDAVSNLRSLQIVDLSYNLIPTLTITKFVKNIYASNNHIHTLETDDNSFIFALEQLHLAKNRLRNVDVLARFGKMTYIDLSYNRLLSVDFALFKNMRSLQTLNLAYNNIFTVTTSELKPLSLQLVDLSHNELTNLKAVDTAGIGSVETLHLDGNYLVSFELAKGATNFQRLRAVSLDGNDWICKDLDDILMQLKTKKVTITPGGKSTCGSYQVVRNGFCCRDLGVSFEEVVLLKSEKLAEIQQSATTPRSLATSTVRPLQAAVTQRVNTATTKPPTRVDHISGEKKQNQIALLESQITILNEENRTLKASLARMQQELAAVSEKLNRCKSSTNQRSGKTVLID
ncbi:uncharacterized protein LOC129758297 [Uranotaenia lowii]|uniref:uncharacterized protein LOC129758297 n=1 Tax=Uranotaenia lowii TaxID=190385 RepID=UPI0024794E36|nr:uncharacterized protein LOC129758297 [Uranotaenia lowii]